MVDNYKTQYMVYRFLMLSDEDENFRRELRINADATFLELNDFLLASLGYDNHELSTFHLCDEDWHKEREITLMDMSFDESNPSLVMSEYKLSDLMEEKGEHLFFVFDMLAERGFFMELAELDAEGQELVPRITFAQGEAPVQMIDLETASNRLSTIEDDSFDQGFEDDFALEGFDDSDLGDYNIYDEY